MKLAVIARRYADLDAAEIALWIERGWVRPATVEAGWSFEPIDVARLDLVYDLRRQLGVSEDTLPLVLALVDQLHALQGTLDAVGRAIDAQPAEIRAVIARAIRAG